MVITSFSQHVNGVDIAGIETSGQAKHTLVLLHGFTGSTATWEPLFPHLAMPDWRLMALDMLGHGQSSKPEDPERYQMDHAAQDIIAVLRERGVQPGEAILLGYSLGGRIALYTALMTDYFRGLLLESASPGLATEEGREERREADEMLAYRIEHEGIEKFVDFWENTPLFASQQRLAPEVRQRLREQRLHNEVRGLANSLRGVGTGAQPSLHELLKHFTQPVAVLVGEEDRKFRQIGEAMAKQFPASLFSCVPGVGHTIHLEDPNTFIKMVRAFCQACVLV
jgi:2-succinyl-6-hydroxy-2,4-cyclohexadiene-1-carboxylate synthase